MDYIIQGGFLQSSAFLLVDNLGMFVYNKMAGTRTMVLPQGVPFERSLKIMADLQIHNFDFNKLMEFASTAKGDVYLKTPDGDVLNLEAV